MAVAANKKSISAAKAHTKNDEQSTPSSDGMFKKILLMFFVGLVALSYQAIQPPPPKLCGTPGGPPVTSPRIKLKDGRHLAYKEFGVSKEKAKYKIVYVHGFYSCRHDVLPVSPELVEDLGIYIVSFDRPGYGESDPKPERTEKTIALDIEELADHLELGPKFYVIGFSMGGEIVWTCLKYIPHRLAGAALLGPVANYWWKGFPSNVSKDAYAQQHLPDQFAVGVAHYAPWLAQWWNSRKWFPGSSVISQSLEIFSSEDMKLLPKFGKDREHYAAQITQQGIFECLHRDMIVGFGNWEFCPMDLVNPFPNGEGSVHLWHGAQDLIVPVTLSRYLSQKLPWVQYHELPEAGHIFILADRMGDIIVKSLLLGEQ